MERYLRALEVALASRGFECPFLLMTSGGGLATLETAARFPIRLIESGPAGGAVLAAAIANELNLPRVLSFDMGGTTAKLCLIDDGATMTARSFEVGRSYRFKKGSGLPIRIPVIEMVEIGAGGGSIARVDSLARLQVGPESSGADPGPACYGRGAARPTVTDADASLGKIAPERFAGGSIALDIEAGRRAIMRDVGGVLGFDGAMAAYAISEVVDENMAAAARAHSIEWGKDIADRAMIAFGGAAPLHATRLGEKLGVAAIVIPADAGVGSAVGFLLAPAAYEVVRSRPMRLDSFDAEAIVRLYAEMRDEARRVILSAAGEVPTAENRVAYMRYRGQGHEIAVTLADELAGAEPAAALAAAFGRTYAAVYGRAIPTMEIEALTWSLTLAGPAPARSGAAQSGRPEKARPQGSRAAFDASRGRIIEHQVFERSALKAGEHLSGPAFIIEDQTTTVVTAAWAACVDGYGNLILERNGRA
jgi:N-methylhydantoinase A